MINARARYVPDGVDPQGRSRPLMSRHPRLLTMQVPVSGGSETAF
jgi:hypothetical protein